MLLAEKCKFCRNILDIPSSHTYGSKTMKKKAKLHCTPENQLVHDFMKCGTIIIIIIIVKHFMKP